MERGGAIPTLRRRTAVALLLLLTVLENAAALRGWWLDDDPQLLLEGIRQPWWAALFDRAEYVHLATHTFTPLLVLSFKVDHLLAGVNPLFFYLHQTIAMAAAVLLLFVVLERLGDRIAATACAALFAVSWQSMYAVRTLMIRHYVEGLVAALAAVLVWIIAAERSVPTDAEKASGVPDSHAAAFRWELGGAALYLVALLSKEVWAPVPFVIVALGVHNRERVAEIVRRLLLPAASLAIFVLWRWWMIGLVGDYNAPPTGAQLAALPRILWHHTIGPATPAVVLTWSLVATLLVAIFVARHGGRGALLLLVVAAAAIAPVLPVAADPQWRYGFAAAVFAISFFGVAASGSFTGRALLIFLALIAAVTSASQRRNYEASRQREITEGKFVWSSSPASGVMIGTTPEWYLQGIADLRRAERHDDPPRFVFSRYALLLGGIDAAQLVAVDPTNGHAMRLSEVPPSAPVAASFGTPAAWATDRVRFRPEGPISVDFAMRGYDATWDLGPAGGSFLFLTDPGFTAVPLPPSGFRRVPPGRGDQWFRIVRTAPDGTWTATPRLKVPKPGEQVRFAR